MRWVSRMVRVIKFLIRAVTFPFWCLLMIGLGFFWTIIYLGDLVYWAWKRD